MVIEEVKIQTGDSLRTVKDLRKELKDLKDQLLNTQKGTAEYVDTMQKAADIQKELKDQMQEVNNSAMDFGQVMGNVSGVMAGVSGAITAATGALSLFGIENEEAQKKITATMTSLIGITQGFMAIDNGIKAFKRLTIAIRASSLATTGFGKALIATGIGAIIVAIGTLIAYWDEFTEAIGASQEKLERLGDIARGVINVITSGLKGLVRAFWKLAQFDFSGAWDELKNGFNVVDNFNAGVERSVAQREERNTKKAQEEAEKRAKAAEEEYQKRIQAAQKLAAWERDMEAAKTRGSASDKYTQAAFDRQMKYFDALFKVYRKDSDEYRALVLEKEQYLQDWDNHLLQVAEDEKEITAERIKYERDLAAAQARGDDTDRYSQASYDRMMSYFDQMFALYDEESDKYKQLVLEKEQYLQDWDKHLADIQQKEQDKENSEAEERQKLLDSFEQELMTEQEHLDQRYQMLIDAATKEGEDTTKIKEWYEKEKTRIVEEEEEKQTTIRQAHLRTYTGIANSIGDILNSVSDMMEQGTEEQKGIAIAATTIQMLAGIATAISGAFTTKTGPWDIVLAATQAAAIAASGIASIVKISQVKPDSSGTSTSTPAISIPSVVSASQDFTQSVDGALTQTAITDQRVYVLEHDITETQNKVQVAEARATY